MSDLIRKSDVLKLPRYSFGVSMLTSEEYIKVSDIKKILTAYSVDKVVEELKELKMRYFLTIANTGDEKSDFAYDNVGNALDKAIEIVKQGGVTDDVCEWKLDGVYLHSPHKPLVSCVTDENYRYNYCPVCGKKIKVVE